MLASSAETHQLSEWGRDQGDKLYNYTQREERGEGGGRREGRLSGREESVRCQGMEEGLREGEREREG